MSLFGKLFGHSTPPDYSKLPADALRTLKARHQHQIDALHRLLPGGDAQPSADRSAVWHDEIQKQLDSAIARGDAEACRHLEVQLAQAQQTHERISHHVDEINEKIRLEEEQIELLERALDALQ